MRVIVVYDVGAERIGNIRKYLRTYLHWIQNSVFEGDLTEKELKDVTAALRGLSSPEDSIIIYHTNFGKYLKREIVGKEKNQIGHII